MHCFIMPSAGEDRHTWAASWQNQQNECAPSKDRSAWASAQSDQSSLCTQLVAKDPSFLHADSEDSDQTGRMPRLIWVFAGRTTTLLVLSCRSSLLRAHTAQTVIKVQILAVNVDAFHYRLQGLEALNHKTISSLNEVKDINEKTNCMSRGKKIVLSQMCQCVKWQIWEWLNTIFEYLFSFELKPQGVRTASQYKNTK